MSIVSDNALSAVNLLTYSSARTNESTKFFPVFLEIASISMNESDKEKLLNLVAISAKTNESNKSRPVFLEIASDIERVSTKDFINAAVKAILSTIGNNSTNRLSASNILADVSIKLNASNLVNPTPLINASVKATFSVNVFIN